MLSQSWQYSLVYLLPTLIKNVENSRKSKDQQNLDTVKEAIVVALQDDAEKGVYSNLATGKTALTITGSDGTVTLVQMLQQIHRQQ